MKNPKEKQNEKSRTTIGESIESLSSSLPPATEQQQPLWQEIHQFKAAILWSAFIGLAGVNWGLDVLLSNGVISVPSFQRDFGYEFQNRYLVSASWQIAFNTAASTGGLFGAIAAGYAADRIGRRGTLGIGCLVSIGGVFMQVFAAGPVVLLVGKLVNGLALGAFLSIPSSFAAEICPVSLRGLTTSGVQLAIGIGQLSANLVLKGTGTLSSSLAYKIPFALQFLFPTILLLGLPFCPESPWHLIRRGAKTPEALTTLSRLGYSSPEKTAEEIANMVDREMKDFASTTYLDCFRGTNRRRTEISLGITSVAQLTGVVFVIGYSSYFFELAGLTPSSSFSLSLGVSILGLVGVVCSWFLINRIGRRPLALYGVTALTILLFLIGILDILPGDNTGPVYGQVTMIILFAFIYLLTIGPVFWTLFVEIPSPRLRSRTVGLGVVVQNLFGILMNIVIPLLINPDSANLRGKIGFIFGGTSLLGVGWIWLRVPETRGRGFGELGALFERGVAARRFEGFVLDERGD